MRQDPPGFELGIDGNTIDASTVKPGPRQLDGSLHSDQIPGFHHDDGQEGGEPGPSSATLSQQNEEKDKKKNKHDGQSQVNNKSWNIYRYTLYETPISYHVVGGDTTDERFRVLRIDRTAENGRLHLVEDDRVYNRRDINSYLAQAEELSKPNGILKTKFSFWGILGFIRFTGPYYMLIIKKRSQVAVLGGHYIYRIDQTELISLTAPGHTRARQTTTSEEARFLGILTSLDLSRSFYFSHAYNITRTLQDNINADRERLLVSEMVRKVTSADFNSMFVWNEHLLGPVSKASLQTYRWCIPIIHGFVDQAAVSVYGRTIFITVIARRSRYFAGARFLKRGANDLGYVANDVETEQIVSDMLTTSFHGPSGRPFASPGYTSYVQHRGSIPLYWAQDNTGVTPKPPIELNLVDPFYSAAALHFDNLFARYGTPLIVLNLIKAREKQPRESKLLTEFSNAISYLNQFLPPEKKIIYKPWDMSRAAHSPDQDVIHSLETIGESVVQATGIFHNGTDADGSLRLQRGICRTNCIDCLDRTNAAQFVIGKRALGHQLHALGILTDDSIDYDSDAVNLFTQMFHDHGDTLAIQYGGSQLVNTMETYRRVNQWSSHSRDMVESFKRYYNNSFLDSQRQEAYNLFLGNYTFVQGQPMLWDLTTDYYLHHANPRAWSERKRRSYVKWYSDAFLDSPKGQHPDTRLRIEEEVKLLGDNSDYWAEYYRPLILSSFRKLFAFTMNSTLQYLPTKPTKEQRYDFSPFRVRHPGQSNEPELIHNQIPSNSQRRAHDLEKQTPASSLPDQHREEFEEFNERGQRQGTQRETAIETRRGPKKLRTVDFAVLGQPGSNAHKPSRLPLRDSEQAAAAAAALTPPPGPMIGSGTIWTIDKAFTSSLNPQVMAQELAEYERYISHPSTLPLVISSETEASGLADADMLDFLEFCNFETRATSELLIEPDVANYEEYVRPVQDPLVISEGDLGKRRYRAYDQWIRGRSMLRQPRLAEG